MSFAIFWYLPWLPGDSFKARRLASFKLHFINWKTIFFLPAQKSFLLFIGYVYAVTFIWMSNYISLCFRSSFGKCDGPIFWVSFIFFSPKFVKKSKISNFQVNCFHFYLYSDCKLAKTSKIARDEHLAKYVWDRTEEIIKQIDAKSYEKSKWNYRFFFKAIF